MAKEIEEFKDNNKSGKRDRRSRGNNKGRGNFKPKQTGIEVEKKEFTAEQPKQEVISKESLYIQASSYRKLQNTGNIETYATPGTDAALSGYPYAIINKANQVIEANYGHTKNIEGNMIVSLQNSLKSGLLNTYDIATINKRINYLYLTYENASGQTKYNFALMKEMVKSFADGISHTYGSLFFQLNFYTQEDVTDIPGADLIGSASMTAFGKVASLLHYQAVLQNIAAPASKYIQTRSLEQVALNMTYRREADIITSLYGLMKKAAFISTLNALGTTMINDYFDVNWFKQNNALMFMSSRKSASMDDPLLTSTCTTKIPLCKMKLNGADDYYYDSSKVLVTTGNYVNPDTFELEENKTLTLEQLVYRIERFMDVSTIIRWARMLITDATSVGVLTSPSAYYENGLNTNISALQVMAGTWSMYMAEIRTFLDKAKDTNLTYWQKGIQIKIGSIDGSVEPKYNMVLADLFKVDKSGAAYVDYNSNTKRWAIFTMWNKYTGVPRFDLYSSGSFLTFGLRAIDSSVTLDNDDTEMMFPKSFCDVPVELTANKILATNRVGHTVEVTNTTSTVLNNASLARLDAFGDGIVIKIPVINDELATGQTRSQAVASRLTSAASKFISRVFGYGVTTAQYRASAESDPSTKSDSICDDDDICLIDIEIDNISNNMITYCRNYSPFRVSTPNSERTMGFVDNIPQVETNNNK